MPSPRGNEIADPTDHADQDATIAEEFEATPVALIVAADAKTIIGWVYLWNSGRASFFWTGDERDGAFLAPVEEGQRPPGHTPSEVRRLVWQLNGHAKRFPEG